MKPIDDIRAAYAAGDSSEAQQRARRRDDSIAQIYGPNVLYDRLLAMDPDMRPQLSPTTLMALGMYEASKHAYEAQQGEEQAEL